MKFTKMQAYGNDYVYIETFTQNLNNPEIWAKFLSDRNYGIGSDGMIMLCPSDCADYKMRVFNPDGSEAEMCGNGLRSTAKLYYDKKFTNSNNITVETIGGIKKVFFDIKDGEIMNITANIGAPIFDSPQIPVIKSNHENGGLVRYPFDCGGRIFKLTAVSLGNPHCGVFAEDAETLDLKKYGPMIERCHLFPNRTNVEFYNVIDRKTIFLRTYERNCGETLACATGCCVAVVSAYLDGKCGNEVEVKQLGGSILIKYDTEKNELWMTGWSKTVFEGEIDDNIIMGEFDEACGNT